MNKDMILEREVKDNMIISNKQVNKKDSYISKFIKHKFIKFNKRHLHAFILSFSLLIIISLSFLITFNVFIKGENNKAYADGNIYDGVCPNTTGDIRYHLDVDSNTLYITGHGTLAPTGYNIWDDNDANDIDGYFGAGIESKTFYLVIKGDSQDAMIKFPQDSSYMFKNIYTQTIYLENCDFSDVTDIYGFLFRCSTDKGLAGNSALVDFTTKNCIGIDASKINNNLYSQDQMAKEGLITNYKNIEYVDLSIFDFTNLNIPVFANSPVNKKSTVKEIILPKGIPTCDVNLYIDPDKYGSRVKYIAVNDNNQVVNGDYSAKTKLMARDTTDTNPDKWITKLILVPADYGDNGGIIYKDTINSIDYLYDDCIACYDVSENKDAHVFIYFMEDGTVFYKSDGEGYLKQFRGYAKEVINKDGKQVLKYYDSNTLLEIPFIDSSIYCYLNYEIYTNFRWFSPCQIYEILHPDYHVKKIFACNKVSANSSLTYCLFASNLEYLEEFDMTNFYSDIRNTCYDWMLRNSGKNSSRLYCKIKFNIEGSGTLYRWYSILTGAYHADIDLSEISNSNLQFGDDTLNLNLDVDSLIKIKVPNEITYNFDYGNDVENYYEIIYKPSGIYSAVDDLNPNLFIIEGYDDSDQLVGYFTRLPDTVNDGVSYIKLMNLRGEDTFKIMSFIFYMYQKDIEEGLIDPNDQFLNYSLELLISIFKNYIDTDKNIIPIDSSSTALTKIQNDILDFDFKEFSYDEFGTVLKYNPFGIVDDYVYMDPFYTFMKLIKETLIEEGKYTTPDAFDAASMMDEVSTLFKDLFKQIYTFSYQITTDSSNLTYNDEVNVKLFNITNNALSNYIKYTLVNGINESLGSVIVQNINGNLTIDKSDITKTVASTNYSNSDCLSNFDFYYIGNTSARSYSNCKITVKCNRLDEDYISTDDSLEFRFNYLDTITLDYYDLLELVNSPSKTKTINVKFKPHDEGIVYSIVDSINVDHSFYYNDFDFDITFEFDNNIYNIQNSYQLNEPKAVDVSFDEDILLSRFATDYTDFDDYLDSEFQAKKVILPQTSEHPAMMVIEIPPTSSLFGGFDSEMNICFDTNGIVKMPYYFFGQSLFMGNIVSMMDISNGDISFVEDYLNANTEERLEDDIEISILDDIDYDYILEHFRKSEADIYSSVNDNISMNVVATREQIKTMYDLIYFMMNGQTPDGGTTMPSMTVNPKYPNAYSYIAFPLTYSGNGYKEVTGDNVSLLLNTTGQTLTLNASPAGMFNILNPNTQKTIKVMPLTFSNKNLIINADRKFADGDNEVTLDPIDVTVTYKNNKGHEIELEYGKDYIIDPDGYKNNVGVGQATFKIKGVEPNVSGTFEGTFTIVDNIDDYKIKDPDQKPAQDPTPDPKPDDKPSITTTTITIGGIVTDPNSTSGYIRGYGDNTIKPNDGITRAEFIKIMAETANNFSINDQTNLTYINDYKDVNENSWYTPYIGYLLKCKVLTGYSDKTIKPNDKITRAEVCSIISNMYDPKASDSISDNTNNSFNRELDNMWYEDCVMKLVNAGIINGYDDGTFKPNNKITRAETVALVNRTLGINNAISDYQKQFVINNYNDLKESDWFFSDIARAIFNKK